MKKLIILLTVLIALGTSCKKDYLSIDEFNPNSASAVPANLILPAAINNTAAYFTQPDNYSFIYLWYGCMSISGGYSQPTNLTQYNLLASAYQGIWSNNYTNLLNYDYIEKNSTTPQNQPYKAIAKIMKVYLYENLVDTYGNIPYKEALQTGTGILKPKYDEQQGIYEDLVLQLDAAMDLINTAPPDADQVGNYDIIYHGDMTLWLKFANTLKLRLLVTQSGMSGRDAYISTAVGTTPHTPADYIGAGEGAWSNPGYLQSAGKMNPFWENFYKQDGSQQADGLGYYVAGQDACDFLTANNDPRKLRLFQPSVPPAGTTVLGNYFGANLLQPVPVTSKLGPGMLQAFNQSAPIMTDFESLFIQAEAAARNIITADAKALYESAVTQSVTYEGGTAAAATTYLAQLKPLVNYDATPNKVQAIVTQKWLSLNGLTPQPIWVDYRRTGFPDFLHFTADAARLNDTPPVRLLYPQSEISTNNDNVVAQGAISLFTSKIFWQNR